MCVSPHNKMSLSQIASSAWHSASSLLGRSRSRRHQANSQADLQTISSKCRLRRSSLRQCGVIWHPGWSSHEQQGQHSAQSQVSVTEIWFLIKNIWVISRSSDGDSYDNVSSSSKEKKSSVLGRFLGRKNKWWSMDVILYWKVFYVSSTL